MAYDTYPEDITYDLSYLTGHAKATETTLALPEMTGNSIQRKLGVYACSHSRAEACNTRLCVSSETEIKRTFGVNDPASFANGVEDALVELGVVGVTHV